MSRNMRPGRPRRFRNRQEFEEAVESYFSSCEEAGRPPTMSGLCLHLGFKSRSQLDYLEKRSRARGQFSNTIRRARTMIEAGYERELLSDDCTPARQRALMFVLAMNHGWQAPPGGAEAGRDAGREAEPAAAIEELPSLEEWERMYQEQMQNRAILPEDSPAL